MKPYPFALLNHLTLPVMRIVPALRKSRRKPPHCPLVAFFASATRGQKKTATCGRNLDARPPNVNP
jgi:hypothetical protein